jgi:hypothetical protein
MLLKFAETPTLFRHTPLLYLATSLGIDLGNARIELRLVFGPSRYVQINEKLNTVMVFSIIGAKARNPSLRLLRFLVYDFNPHSWDFIIVHFVQ